MVFSSVVNFRLISSLLPSGGEHLDSIPCHCSQATSWRNSVQNTRHVDSKELVLASWQHPSTFIPIDPHFLTKHRITSGCQPPYSPDLAPCDFWLFPKLKTPLKGPRFDSREEIMRTRRRSWTPFQKKASRGVCSSESIGGLCVEAQGAYFEGD
jgi:hypothetical protein